MRVALLGCLIAACVTGSVSAENYATFSDPTVVNLLQKWSTDGTWMIGAQGNHNGNSIGTQDLQRAVVFARYAAGWRVNINQNSVISVTYTFPSPVTIDTVSLSFFEAGHMPSTANCVTFSFDRGDDVIVDCRLVTTADNGAVRYPISERTVTSMTVTFNPAVTGNNGVFELDGIGAYLAKGQSLAIDGTYNVFYQESSQTAEGTGSFANAWKWADCSGDTVAQPNGGPGLAEWHFSQDYTFYGAHITYMMSNILRGAQVWVSDDEGLTWRPMIALDVDEEGNEIPFNWKQSYQSFAEPLTGSWVRLTWEDSSVGSSEITSFQLFGAAIVPVPEPATMSLLALGGLALLRRRRA